VETVEQQTWAGRFSLLSPWFSDIVSSVKRDCKSEHLRLDPGFVRQHFGGLPIQRITIEEMRAVYLQQILAGHERLAEFIANRWLFRNMDIYRFFEESLQKISPEFEKITEVPAEQAETIVKEACEKFGCEKTFCFVAINEVALSKPIFDRLQRQALERLSERQKEMPADEKEETEGRLRVEMERLKERHEKKVAEMTRKHQQEVHRLHKEISVLKAEALHLKSSKVTYHGRSA
jgi:hypothetical protein